MAVRDAARALAASLAPYLAAAGDFSGAVRAAMRDGVQLSATGWWDNPVKEDQYSTCGVAVSEVRPLASFPRQSLCCCFSFLKK
jgi:hypothetical protein